VYSATKPGQPGEGGSAVPVSFALSQNHLNPFSQSTVIQFDLPTKQDVKLQIYDIRGRLVRQLANGPFPAGRWSVTWNRQGASGVTVALGVYFYRLEAGSYQAEKKMMVLQ